MNDTDTHNSQPTENLCQPFIWFYVRFFFLRANFIWVSNAVPVAIIHIPFVHSFRVIFCHLCCVESCFIFFDRKMFVHMHINAWNAANGFMSPVVTFFHTHLNYLDVVEFSSFVLILPMLYWNFRTRYRIFHTINFSLFELFFNAISCALKLLVKPLKYHTFDGDYCNIIDLSQWMMLLLPRSE